MTAASVQTHVQHRSVARLIGTIADHLVTTLLAIVVICLLVSALPGFFGYGAVRVMGASMGRSIPVGSVAVLAHVTAEDTRVGDVILYSGKGATIPVMHRVVSISRKEGRSIAVTRGDANTAPDPTPRVLNGAGGRVIASVPWAGFVLTALRIRLVWVLVVLAMVRRLARVTTRAELG